MQFQFTRKNLDNLLQLTNQTVISIIFPTYQKGSDQQQNSIRFSNLIKTAKEQLEKSGLSTHALKVQIDEAAKTETDTDFWQHQKNGMAVYITEDSIQYIKLPIEVEEIVQVTNRPIIGPLLPLITTNGQFYILTLSQNDIKLYQANRTDIDKLYLGDIPKNMEEHFDMTDLKSHLQFHSSNGHGNGSMFHGQGGGDESVKSDISQFLNVIENGVTKLLEGESAPLVLAGVEYLTSMYAKHNKYNHLLETRIEGNPDQTTKEKLHSDAWEIVRPLFKDKEKAALDVYHQSAGTGKTSNTLEEIVIASHEGRVQTLFARRGKQVWGEYVEDKRTVLPHVERSSHSNDLIELCIAQTIKNGGQVYSLKDEEMINGFDVAATYRY